jgi:hypothetical protein
MEFILKHPLFDNTKAINSCLLLKEVRPYKLRACNKCDKDSMQIPKSKLN